MIFLKIIKDILTKWTMLSDTSKTSTYWLPSSDLQNEKGVKKRTIYFIFDITDDRIFMLNP